MRNGSDYLGPGWAQAMKTQRIAEWMETLALVRQLEQAAGAMAVDAALAAVKQPADDELVVREAVRRQELARVLGPREARDLRACRF